MYYPLFDWLRMLLALIVAIGHSGLISWHHSGNLAVQCFFALSGWLIGGILLNAKTGDLPRFFFNRAARIWIPYFFALALLLSASLLKDNVTDKWLEFIFYKTTFVYNWFGTNQLATFRQDMPLQGTGNHFWSICTEEQFYLLSPLVLLILPIKLGRSIALWSLVSFFAIIFDLYASISLGVFAAVCKQRFSDWHVSKVSDFALSLLIILFTSLLYFYDQHYRHIAPLFAICLIAILARKGPKTKWGAFWGGISYPFYLNHWIGVFVANEFFEKFALRESLMCKVTALFLNILIAAVFYMLIDKPVRHFRQALFTEKRGLFAGVTAYSLFLVGTCGGIYLTAIH